MCMIAYRPVTDDKRGGNIPNAVIDAAMTRHPDGFGVAWREDGELRTAKFGPSARKAFRTALKRVDRAGFEYVAHFRYATHGPKVESHAHPYEYTHDVDGRVLVFHNGVIDIRTTPQESDTEVFVRDVLAHLPSRWWESPALRYLVNEAIGWSKLTLMTADGVYNLHESRGEWDGGIWYSSTHKPTPKSTWTAGTVSTCTHKRKYTEACTDCKRAAYQPTSSKGQAGVKPLTTVTAVVPFTQPDEVVALYDRPRQFRHAGHNLTAVKDIKFDADYDYEDAVICDTCRTIGTVYVIDGSYFIDMAHMYGSDLADEDDLLPGVVIESERS